MFGDRPIKTERFVRKEYGRMSGMNVYYDIMADRITGVNYLKVTTNDGIAITPLLNENGTVVIDK